MTIYNIQGNFTIPSSEKLSPITQTPLYKTWGNIISEGIYINEILRFCNEAKTIVDFFKKLADEAHDRKLHSPKDIVLAQSYYAFLKEILFQLKTTSFNNISEIEKAIENGNTIEIAKVYLKWLVTCLYAPLPPQSIPEHADEYLTYWGAGTDYFVSLPKKPDQFPSIMVKNVNNFFEVLNSESQKKAPDNSTSNNNHTNKSLTNNPFTIELRVRPELEIMPDKEKSVAFSIAERGRIGLQKEFTTKKDTTWELGFRLLAEHYWGEKPALYSNRSIIISDGTANFNFDGKNALNLGFDKLYFKAKHKFFSFLAGISDDEQWFEKKQKTFFDNTFTGINTSFNNLHKGIFKSNIHLGFSPLTHDQAAFMVYSQGTFDIKKEGHSFWGAAGLWGFPGINGEEILSLKGTNTRIENEDGTKTIANKFWSIQLLAQYQHTFKTTKKNSYSIKPWIETFVNLIDGKNTGLETGLGFGWNDKITLDLSFIRSPADVLPAFTTTGYIGPCVRFKFKPIHFLNIGFKYQHYHAKALLDSGSTINTNKHLFQTEIEIKL